MTLKFSLVKNALNGFPFLQLKDEVICCAFKKLCICSDKCYFSNTHQLWGSRGVTETLTFDTVSCVSGMYSSSRCKQGQIFVTDRQIKTKTPFVGIKIKLLKRLTKFLWVYPCRISLVP